MIQLLTLVMVLVGAALIGRNLLRSGGRAQALYVLGAVLFAFGFYGSILAYIGVI